MWKYFKNYICRGNWCIFAWLLHILSVWFTVYSYGNLLNMNPSVMVLTPDCVSVGLEMDMSKSLSFSCVYLQLYIHTYIGTNHSQLTVSTCSVSKIFNFCTRKLYFQFQYSAGSTVCTLKVLERLKTCTIDLHHHNFICDVRFSHKV